MSITSPQGVRDSLMRAALAMAARGWHVFPCVADGKRPALRGSWQQHATTDAGRIRHWWASAPYNIGISCGPSGLVIIDLDVAKDGSGPHGADSLAQLCARHGQPRLSGTLTVRTPSGGTHLYFRAAARPVRNSAWPPRPPHRHPRRRRLRGRPRQPDRRARVRGAWRRPPPARPRVDHRRADRTRGTAR